MKDLITRVADRASVIPFRAKVPTLSIGGTKYVLSTDGGPLGDREDDDAMPEETGGPKVIRQSGGNKWRYLWAYDTDRAEIAMWRVSDGSEKLYDRASNQARVIVKLDKRGQLNRVSNSDFRRIENHMRQQEQSTLNDLEKVVEDSKDAYTKKVDKLVAAYFDVRVVPGLEKALADVDRGAIPFGFKPSDPSLSGEGRIRQMRAHVLGAYVRKEFSVAIVSAWLEKQGIDLDQAGQWINWAVDDCYEKAAKEYLR